MAVDQQSEVRILLGSTLLLEVIGFIVHIPFPIRGNLLWAFPMGTFLLRRVLPTSSSRTTFRSSLTRRKIQY